MKYELTDESKEIGETVVHRIRALRDFANIKKGELGGYIEFEKNLSHEGNAWVSDDACVYDNAKVSDNAEVYGCAQIFDNAKVSGNATVSNYASIYGDAWVYGYAQVFEYAEISGNATVSDHAFVYGDAWIYDEARIYDEASVKSDASVYERAWVYGNARVHSNARISGNARIAKTKDYMTISPIGSENGVLTIYKSEEGILCNRGCFRGTLEEFEESVQKKHGNNQYGIKYKAAINFARINFM